MRAKYYRFLSLVLLTWFLPGSLLADSGDGLGMDCHQNWCTIDVAKFEGEAIRDVSFLTWINLDHDELMKSVEFAPGEVFSLALAKRSIENLHLRDIFQHIELRVKDTSEGLRVQFVLTPTLRLDIVSFSGNLALDDETLRRSAGLRPGALLDIPSFGAARRRLVERYQEQGFYSAEISLRLLEAVAEPKVEAIFDISEGPQSSISSIEVLGQLPEDIQSIAGRVRSFGIGLPASKEVVERLRWETLLVLRREGYIQASVEPIKRIYQPLTGEVELVLRISPRDPISFFFEGNEVLSNEQLLEPLRLETRRVPFSPSAILSLQRDIVRLYQARGYYFARVEKNSETSVGGRDNYHIQIDEGEVWDFVSIRFSGNESFDDEELLSRIRSKPNRNFLTKFWFPSYLVDSVIEEDRQALEKAYRLIGQSATVVQAHVHTLPSRELELEFEIRESAPAVVRSSELEWEDVIPEQGEVSDELAHLFLIYPQYELGSEYVSEKVDEERRRIEQQVRDAGFPNASTTVEYDEEEELLRFVVNPGEAIRVGKIWLQGNNYTHDEVIRRELSVEEGQLWRGDDIARSQRALYGLGFFRRVEVGPLDGVLDDSKEDLRVRVLERDTGSLSAGIAFTTEDGVHLSGELAQRNLFGWGSGLIFGVDGYFKAGDEVFDAGRLRAAYVRPRFLTLPVDFSLEAFLQTNVTSVDQFSSDKVGVASEWRFGILEDLRGTIGLTGFHERLFDVEEDIVIVPSDSGSTFYSILHTSLEFDRRDNIYNPREGSRTELGVSVAAEAIGSEENFFAAEASQAFYLPLGSKWVWSNRFAGTYLLPFADTQVIPLGQRTFLGGRHSLRGYSKNSIGPRGVLGTVAGGDSSLNAQTEFRYDISENVAGVLFLDLGQAFLLEEGSFAGDSNNLGDLRFSPGFGFHYKTPIGPLSAELGFATERENGERWGRLNVAIGTAF